MSLISAEMRNQITPAVISEHLLDLLFKDKWMKGRLWHLLSKRHMFGESTQTALNKTGSENVKNVMPRLTVDRSFQERAAVCVCVCCYISAQFHLYKITRWKTFLNSLEFFSRHDCSCRLTSKIQLFSPPSGHPGWSGLAKPILSDCILNAHSTLS